MLNKLAVEYRDQGLVILAITDEERAVVQRFVEEHKYTLPTLLDSGRKVMDHYGVQGIPRTLVLNRVGERLADFTESRESEVLQALGAAGLLIEKSKSKTEK